MRLYLKYLSIHIKSQMQYKVSFFLTVTGQFLTSFSAFLGIYFMMTRFNKVDDFSFSEVLLCFATVLIAFSLAECFARSFDTFSGMIGNGEFDRIMVRPRNEMFQVLASKLELSRMGRLIQAVIVFAYAIPASGVAWSADKVITLVLMIISGIAIFSGLFVIYAAFCFFTTEGLEFMNIFTDGGREFGRYPLSIYGEGILRFFTFVIPLALFQYYPFLYLTGRSANVLYILFPLVGFMFLIPCHIIWKIGVRHYKSTGS
ncbi:MAG TPA: ABC-2 family transporter protein [Clostridia bacterium]|nr:ABC-2 family transporter protein [Clostridia bacterium]